MLLPNHSFHKPKFPHSSVKCEMSDQFKIDFAAEGVDADDLDPHGIAEMEGLAVAAAFKCLGVQL